jgi:hypothetical protein
MRNILQQTTLIILSILFIQKVSAQNESAKKDYAHLSADLNLGLPYMVSPIGYSITGMGGVGLRYSFNKFFSLQASYNLGQFSGEQTIGSTILGDPTKLEANKLEVRNNKSFSTTMNQVTLRGLFNVRKMFSEPETINKWNYYLQVGVGYLFYSTENVRADNTSREFSYNKGTRNYVLGVQARKHLNSSWDFLCGVDFNYNRTSWLDGTPLDGTPAKQKDYNHAYYFNAGISYKFNTKNNRELIDWSNLNYSYNNAVAVDKIPVVDAPKVVEPVKVIEPVVVEPIKVVEPVVVVEPIKVVEPVVVVEPVKVAEPVKVVEPVKVIETPANNFENSENITEPADMFNVVVACYSLNHLDLALKFRNSVREKGFKANVYKSLGSKYYRVMTTSSNDKNSALSILKKSKVEIDSKSWFYLYNKK